MNKTYSIYRTSDGLFTGGRLHVPEADLTRNLRDGEAHIEGVTDHLSQRVDLTTGTVINYQPPQPSPDHEWNAETKRWRLTPAAAAKCAAAELARAQIKQLEASQHRAVREATLGDPSAVKRLMEIEDKIKALRNQL